MFTCKSNTTTITTTTIIIIIITITTNTKPMIDVNYWLAEKCAYILRVRDVCYWFSQYGIPLAVAFWEFWRFGKNSRPSDQFHSQHYNCRIRFSVVNSMQLYKKSHITLALYYNFLCTIVQNVIIFIVKNRFCLIDVKQKNRRKLLHLRCLHIYFEIHFHW